MDMSFKRHGSFRHREDHPDAPSGKQLDYARLVALSQKAQSQGHSQHDDGLDSDRGDAGSSKSVKRCEIHDRIALVNGEKQMTDMGLVDFKKRIGPFLDTSCPVPTDPEMNDKNVKSKLAVYPEYLGSGKSPDVENTGEEKS